MEIKKWLGRLLGAGGWMLAARHYLQQKKYPKAPKPREKPAMLRVDDLIDIAGWTDGNDYVEARVALRHNGKMINISSQLMEARIDHGGLVIQIWTED